MREFFVEQRELILEAYEKLCSINDSEASWKINDKWSRIEILGHLVDSASNNHQRFIRAQFKDDLIFSGYEQNDWVRVQNYQEANWQSLIDLWKNFNVLIIHALSKINAEVLLTKREKHNLDEIGWQTIDKNMPATLDYLIKDYFGHMHHHLNQVWKYGE